MRTSRRASRWMTSPARVTASPRASPSTIACAKPWIEVRGVRSSCEMSARNARSLPRARWISPAISLKAVPSSATSFGPDSGTRVSYSPFANRRAPEASTRSGRVIVRERSAATTSANPAETAALMSRAGSRSRMVSAKTARGRATTMKPWPPAPTTARRSCCRTKIHCSSFSVNVPIFAVLTGGIVKLTSVPSLSTTTRRCGVITRSRAFAARACSVSASTISRGCCPERTPVWIAVRNGAESSSSRSLVWSFS